MNQGRIWCVVNPTVGLPLFLTGVALTSLTVHACVLSHVSWFGNYWQGGSKKVAELSTGTAVATSQAPGFTFTVTPTTTDKGATKFTVNVAPSADTAHPVSLAAK